MLKNAELRYESLHISERLLRAASTFGWAVVRSCYVLTVDSGMPASVNECIPKHRIFEAEIHEIETRLDDSIERQKFLEKG